MQEPMAPAKLFSFQTQFQRSEWVCVGGGHGGGNCRSCSPNITAGERMELFEVKFSFLAEIGNVGGGRRAPETSQAVRLKGTPHFKIHRRYILRFDITEQPKLYLFYTLACGRIGLICPDSSPCWDNTCQSAPAMFVFSKIIVRNDCTESWQVGQTVFSEHPSDPVS